MLGCTAQRTWKVPALGKLTVKLGRLPCGAPELTVFLPVTALPPDGARAAGFRLICGVTPLHQ